jgi:hypothetical protein
MNPKDKNKQQGSNKNIFTLQRGFQDVLIHLISFRWQHSLVRHRNMYRLKTIISPDSRMSSILDKYISNLIFCGILNSIALNYNKMVTIQQKSEKK